MHAFTSLAILAGCSLVHAASNGCGKDHSKEAASDSSTEFSIESSGGERTFLVHVPSNYNEDKKTGMIVSYHGAGKNSSNQEALSQFSKQEYNPDWIAVYPQGYGNHWEGPSYADSDVHDTKFTSDLLDYMRAHYCIDDTRIYANGKSNGGGFVGTLACHSVGGQFAAFSPVSGAFYTDLNNSSPCTPTRKPLPIMEFHGQADTRVPYKGKEDGTGGPLPSVPGWLQRWAVRDGCPSPPSNYSRRPDVYDEQVLKSSFNCSGFQDIVTGYYINGLGHDWPSKSPNSDNPDNPTVIEATKVIMNFFQKYRLVNGKTVVSN